MKNEIKSAKWTPHTFLHMIAFSRILDPPLLIMFIICQTTVKTVLFKLLLVNCVQHYNKAWASPLVRINYLHHYEHQGWYIFIIASLLLYLPTSLSCGSLKYTLIITSLLLSLLTGLSCGSLKYTLIITSLLHSLL